MRILTVGISLLMLVATGCTRSGSDAAAPGACTAAIRYQGVTYEAWTAAPAEVPWTPTLEAVAGRCEDVAGDGTTFDGGESVAASSIPGWPVEAVLVADAPADQRSLYLATGLEERAREDMTSSILDVYEEPEPGPAYDRWLARDPLPPCPTQEAGTDLRDHERVVADCLAAAQASGEGAEGVIVYTTVEGDPIPVYVRVLADGAVETYSDSTEDNFGSKRWSFRAGCPSMPRLTRDLRC